MAIELINKKKSARVEFLYSKKDFAAYGLKREFRLSLPFRVKKSDETKRMIIKGYASTTDQDRVDDIITLGALENSKNDLLQEGSRTVFFNHDRDIPIGKVIDTNIDSKGLIVYVLISNADDVKNYRTKIREGVLNSFSIGGRFKKVQVERDKKGNVLAFKVLELELFEVSVVGIPANPKASITEVIEKSLRKLLPKKPKERKVHMKDKAKKESEKKESEKEQEVQKSEQKPMVETLTEKSVSEMINKAVSPIATAVSDLVKIVKEIKPVEKPAEKTEIKKDEEIPAWAKKLTEDMEELKKVKKASRKGVVEDGEEEEEEEISDATPKKDLSGLDSDACNKYLNHIMNVEPSLYNKLTDEEKATARGLWLKKMDKVARKK